MSQASSANTTPHLTGQTQVVIRIWRLLVNRVFASANGRVFAVTIGLAILAVATKVAGCLKEVVVAFNFGAGHALDAFLIALLLPSFITVVLSSACGSALIPTYIHVRERDGRVAAHRLFSSVMFWNVCLLLVLSLLLAAARPFLLPLLTSGFSVETKALASLLFLLLIPSLFLSGLSASWSAVLNAEERFAVVGMSEVFIPIVTVFFLLLLAPVMGIRAAAAGLVVGAFAQFAFLAWRVRRSGIPLLPRWSPIDANLRLVLRQYMPMVAGAVLITGTCLIDTAMASTLTTGSVSALSYGNKIVAFILGVASLSFSRAVFPHLARLVAAQRWSDIRQTLLFYTKIVLSVSVPITVLLCLCSRPLISLVFQRGAFTSDDVDSIAIVQTMYAIQIPFYVTGMYLTRIVSAMKKNQILFVLAGISIVANTVFNYLFMGFLGVAGIALSTTLVYAISLFLMAITLRQILRKDL